MNDFDDIINLSRPEPIQPPMPLKNRAAQFAPFAALTGHDDAIDSTARSAAEQFEHPFHPEEEIEQTPSEDP